MFRKQTIISTAKASVPWTYVTNILNQYTSATVNGAPLAFAYDRTAA